jgi:hypothetical protein
METGFREVERSVGRCVDAGRSVVVAESQRGCLDGYHRDCVLVGVGAPYRRQSGGPFGCVSCPSW